MTRSFVSCKGKHACRENETHCLTCSRTLEEVYQTRELVEQMTNFARAMDYDNAEEFFSYLAAKAAKKYNWMKENETAQRAESN